MRFEPSALYCDFVIFRGKVVTCPFFLKIIIKHLQEPINFRILEVTKETK